MEPQCTLLFQFSLTDFHWTVCPLSWMSTAIVQICVLWSMFNDFITHLTWFVVQLICHIITGICNTMSMISNLCLSWTHCIQHRFVSWHIWVKLLNNWKLESDSLRANKSESRTFLFCSELGLTSTELLFVLPTSCWANSQSQTLVYLCNCWVNLNDNLIYCHAISVYFHCEHLFYSQCCDSYSLELDNFCNCMNEYS